MTEQTQAQKDMWSFLERNVLEPSTPSGKVSIPEGFNWLREVQKWREAYRAQSLWLGSQMMYGNPLPTPVHYVRERLSRRLKHLRKAEELSLLYGWIDEPFDWNKLYKTGESLKIENKNGRIQALPKVSRVRGKRRRNR